MGDHFIAPGHRLADVGEADLGQLAQDPLDVDLGPLSAARADFVDQSLNLRIS
jgi:hypothetical protein